MSDAPPPEPSPGATPDAPGSADEGEQVMDLLAEHVPLALLVDLITPEGPASDDILRAEGLPDDAWWEVGDGGRTSADPAP